LNNLKEKTRKNKKKQEKTRKNKKKQEKTQKFYIFLRFLNNIKN
jgi:hypothetical protein